MKKILLIADLRQKIKQLALILSSSLLVCCDSNNESQPIELSEHGYLPANVASELAPHVNLFFSKAMERGIILPQSSTRNLTARFGNLPPNQLGQCTSNDTTGIADIIISNTLNTAEAKWVVLHELGHCLLHREHQDDFLSIMNSGRNFEMLEQANQEELFDDLFQK